MKVCMTFATSVRRERFLTDSGSSFSSIEVYLFKGRDRESKISEEDRDTGVIKAFMLVFLLPIYLSSHAADDK